MSAVDARPRGRGLPVSEPLRPRLRARRPRCSEASTRSWWTSRTWARATTRSSGRWRSPCRPARAPACPWSCSTGPIRSAASAVEGNVLDPALPSFVGLHPAAGAPRHDHRRARARIRNETQGFGCDLHRRADARLAPRDALARTRGCPWVLPSPNMPTLDTALRLSRAAACIEGTNLSEGRGTTRPFELSARPSSTASALARRARAGARLPGVRFRAAALHARPSTSGRAAVRRRPGARHRPRARFRSFATYLRLIAEARRQGGARFSWRRPPYEFERRRCPSTCSAATTASGVPSSAACPSRGWSARGGPRCRASPRPGART